MLLHLYACSQLYHYDIAPALEAYNKYTIHCTACANISVQEDVSWWYIHKHEVEHDCCG